jgi:hypothetical protein
MAQLLQYGIGLGQAQNTDQSPDALLKEAEVRLVARILCFFLTTNSTPPAPRRRT